MKTKPKGRPHGQPEKNSPKPRVEESTPNQQSIRKPVQSETSPKVTRSIQLSPAVRYVLIGLLTLLILGPAFWYYRVVFGNAVNVPFEDDFDSALLFASNYLYKTPTFVGKVQRIFSQHNEHRIVLDRLAFLTDYSLTGHINFRHLIIFGNLSLLVVVGLLYLSSFRSLTTLQKLAYFLPVPFLLFQMHFWELTVWGMASIQNLYIVAFALLSFYALGRGQQQASWFWTAIVSAIIATFTSGNGIFVFIIGIPVLFLQKAYRSLGIWTVVGVATAALYFWGYAKPGHHPPIFETLTKNPGQFFDYFFTLTGSDFATQPTWPVRAGKWMLALFVGLLIWKSTKRQLTTNVAILALLSFMYLTSLSVTMARSGFGIQQALSPRYGILPVMLLISLYILTLETIKHRIGQPIFALFGLLLAVYLCQYSYQQNLPKVEDRTALLKYGSALYNDNKANLILYRDDKGEAKGIFQDALKKDIYQVPSITLADLSSPPKSFDASQLVATNDVTAQAQPFLTNGFLVMYQAWAIMNGIPSENTIIEVVAQSPQGSYAFSTSRHIRYDIVNQFQSMQYMHAGFSCVIKKADLKPGQYKLWLHLTNKNTQSYFLLPGVLDL
ncbi:hypothetical protein GO755_19390 [Spirosoma sp. HMF4905]|uniref:Glycosyltransferase RgtA/B/C/D-like domain-containing protein n=1 Tax=Spirosoma arboris TaxID=2682092 RepID=A0A7K1SEK0_9BACT|nr:hypothetical protein [Spirosoma arboris]MVM32221.1 hypothetical protein [Spirosoma arboris]